MSWLNSNDRGRGPRRRSCRRGQHRIGRDVGEVVADAAVRGADATREHRVDGTDAAWRELYGGVVLRCSAASANGEGIESSKTLRSLVNMCGAKLLHVRSSIFYKKVIC